MVEWKGITGKNFDSDDDFSAAQKFEDFLITLDIEGAEWRPDFVVLHNTQDPSLKTFPNGLTEHYIKETAVEYYRDELGWSGGPHIFVDDRRIWVFTPLTVPGVHANSWNNRSFGVEMLGDYDKEDFNSGRGLEVQKNAVAVVALLCYYWDLDPDDMKLHRENPQTTHHCPGKTVDKAAFIQAVKDYLA